MLTLAKLRRPAVADRTAAGPGTVLLAGECAAALPDGSELSPPAAADWFAGGPPRGVAAYDLLYAAPKSVSLLAAGDDRAAAAHLAAVRVAMAYLAVHAGYTRIHNRVTGRKDLLRLPGLAAVAYEGRRSLAGDPHLHTHVLLRNRQPRPDGRPGSLDGVSLYYEARAAGTLYQAALRADLSARLGVGWTPVDPHTGMADLAGADRDLLAAASTRSLDIDRWTAQRWGPAAAGPGPSHRAAAQRATRPAARHRPTGRAEAAPAAGGGDPTPAPAAAAVLALLAARGPAFTRSRAVQAAVSLWQVPAARGTDLLAQVEQLADDVLAAARPCPGGPRRPDQREGSLRWGPPAPPAGQEPAAPPPRPGRG